MAKSVFQSRISKTNTSAVFPIDRFPHKKVLACVTFKNNWHVRLQRRLKKFQLSKFCIYGHKISQGYSTITDYLKRAGIFRKSVYFFFYGVRSWLLHFEYSKFSLMSSKILTTRGIKNPQHVLCLQTVLKLARWQVVAEIGFCGTWNLQKQKRSIGNTALVFVYEIRLWKTDFAII